MTKKCIWTTGIVLVSAALLGQPARANECGASDAAGRWGFTLTGWLILPTGAVPAAAVGEAHIDTKGSVTGTEARNVAGGYADETLSGSLTLNPDCTGTVTVLGGPHADIFVSPNGDELAWINTDPGFVATLGPDRRVAPK